MKVKCLICGFILSFCMVFLFPGARAGDSAAVITSLRELLELVDSRNPDLLAAREEAGAVSSRPGAVGGYPDPRLTFTHFIDNIETRLGPQKDILQLVQPVPFPGKLSTKREVAGYEGGILAEEARTAELKARSSAAGLFFALAAVDEVLRLIVDERRLLESIEELTRTRLETGRSYQHEVLKVDIEKSKLDEKSILYRRKRESLTARLDALIGAGPGESIRYEPGAVSTETPDVPLDALISASLDHPSLRSKKLTVKRQERMLALAKKDYLPDFTIATGYIWIGESPLDVPLSGKDAWTVSVGLRIPLWFGKVRSDVAEKRGWVRFSEAAYEASKAARISRIRDVYAGYVSDVEIVRLYERELIPKAIQSLESAREGYLSGSIDFLYILDAERVLLDLRIALTEKRTDAVRGLARLEEESGMALVLPDNSIRR